MAHLLGVKRLVLVGRAADRLQKVAALASRSVAVDIIATERLAKDWVEKRGLAKAIGALLLPQGADAVIDLIPNGHDFYQVLAGLRTDGAIVHLGGNFSLVPVPAGVIMQKCWKFYGSRNHSRADALQILTWLKQKDG